MVLYPSVHCRGINQTLFDESAFVLSAESDGKC
jgi:hypothetical protein